MGAVRGRMVGVGGGGRVSDVAIARVLVVLRLLAGLLALADEKGVPEDGLQIVVRPADQDRHGAAPMHVSDLERATPAGRV